MVIDGFQVSHRSIPSGGMSVVMLDAEIVQLSGGPALTVLSEIDTSNNIALDTDLGTDDNQDLARNYEVTNASNGSGLRLMPKSGVGTGRQRGYLRVFKDVDFAFEDDAGAPLADVRVYSVDTDNGFRKNANGLDSLADKTYEATSDAGGAVALSIETAITNIDSEGAFTYDQWDTTALGNRFKVDRRGLDDTTDDRFRFRFGSYAFGLSETTPELRGLGTLSVPWTLFPDLAITEQNRATVDAYATLDNNQQLYDRQKSFLVDNWGTYLDQIISPSGDAGSSDVVIDPGAGEAFDFDGSTITINSSTFVGNITTTGVVTLQGGATVDGLVSDANGIQTLFRFTNVQSGTEIRIHRAADNSEVGSGIESSTAPNLSIPYLFSGTPEEVNIAILALGFQAQFLRGFSTSEEIQVVPVNQAIDRNYENN